jgi:hypothetical protein
VVPTSRDDNISQIQKNRLPKDMMIDTRMEEKKRRSIQGRTPQEEGLKPTRSTIKLQSSFQPN